MRHSVVPARLLALRWSTFAVWAQH